MISRSSARGLTIRRCRPLERKRPPIDRPLANLRVTYFIGRDYDRELNDRATFVRETLRDDADDDDCDDACCRKRRENLAVRRCSNDCDGADLLKTIGRYFSYFYNIAHVTHLSCERDGFFGAAVDETARTLYLRFDERDLALSMFCSEAIPEERVIVNDRPIVERYASRCDKRVYSLLALIARIERIVYESLCRLSQERTIAEMLFVDDTDLRGRCSLDRIAVSRRSDERNDDRPQPTGTSDPMPQLRRDDDQQAPVNMRELLL